MKNLIEKRQAPPRPVKFFPQVGDWIEYEGTRQIITRITEDSLIGQERFYSRLPHQSDDEATWAWREEFTFPIPS